MGTALGPKTRPRKKGDLMLAQPKTGIKTKVYMIYIRMQLFNYKDISIGQTLNFIFCFLFLGLCLSFPL